MRITGILLVAAAGLTMVAAGSFAGAKGGDEGDKDDLKTELGRLAEDHLAARHALMEKAKARRTGRLEGRRKDLGEMELKQMKDRHRMAERHLQARNRLGERQRKAMRGIDRSDRKARAKLRKEQKLESRKLREEQKKEAGKMKARHREQREEFREKDRRNCPKKERRT